MSTQPMIDLLVLLRHSQMHNQNVHHLANGPTSKQDHGIASDLYGDFDKAYDELAEIIVGLGIKVDLPAVNKAAASDLPPVTDNESGFQHSLQLETKLCGMIADLVPNSEDGVQNFLQELAQTSLGHQYHLNQRLA